MVSRFLYAGQRMLSQWLDDSNELGVRISNGRKPTIHDAGMEVTGMSL